MIKLVLEQTPPELSADIIEKGIILTGGGALIKGLPELLQEELKVPVYKAEESSIMRCRRHRNNVRKVILYR